VKTTKNLTSLAFCETQTKRVLKLKGTNVDPLPLPRFVMEAVGYYITLKKSVYEFATVHKSFFPFLKTLINEKTIYYFS
jgi:hypothetical protein